MGEKIVKCGIKREAGWLYYIDKDGDVCRVKATRGRKEKKDAENK